LKKIRIFETTIYGREFEEITMFPKTKKKAERKNTLFSFELAQQ